MKISRYHFCRLALLGTGLLLSAASFGRAAEAPPAHKPRLLIVGQSSDGHPPTTHEFMPGAAILAELLQKSDDLEVTVVRADEPWPEGPKLIDAADGLVMLVTQGARWMQTDEERFAAIKRLCARGGALVALHWAVGSAEAKYIQGQVDLLGATRGGPQRKYVMIATEWKRVAGMEKHPILTGVGDIKAYDEVYYSLDRIPAAQPLLTAEIEGKAEMAAWTLERPDGGRAFGFVGLHFHSNWQRPEYRRLVLQAVRWTLKLPIPAEGMNVDIDPRKLALNGELPPPASAEVWAEAQAKLKREKDAAAAAEKAGK